MNSMSHAWRRLLFAALSGLALATPAFATDGADFPAQAPASDGNGRLSLAGSATMQRNFVPFYATGLYVPMSVRTADQLLSGLSPCRIQLVWVMPELDVDGVREYWRKALESAAGSDDYPRVRAQAERLALSMPAARRGQTLVFDYVPDAGMRVLVDDHPVAQLAGVEFNRTLLSVWLGPSAPSDFREALAGDLRKH